MLEVRSASSSHVDTSTLQLLDQNGLYVTNKEVAAENDSHVNVTSILLGSRSRGRTSIST